MEWLLTPPSIEDVSRLLRAWRFWAAAAFIGALIAALVFYLVPPPYEATATVLVDFNLEQAWPEETDRQQFYYLERETRKLEEIAWSDAVLQEIARTEGAVRLGELRNGILSLSQPAEGGWHFHAVDADPERAAALATAWARAFVEEAQLRASAESGPSSFISVSLTQSAEPPSGRSTALSTYLLVGALALPAAAAFIILFTGKPR